MLVEVGVAVGVLVDVAVWVGVGPVAVGVGVGGTLPLDLITSRAYQLSPAHSSPLVS